MNEKNALYSVILHRFFVAFKNVTYQRVAICQYVYRKFMSFIGEKRLNAYYPYAQAEINQMVDSQIYSLLDGPYAYDPHPGGIILMRAGFGDIASAHLPRNRFYLISPSQAEVDVIKLNRPDLTAYNLQEDYRDNPVAVNELNRQIAEVVQEQHDDPLLGSRELQQWFERLVPEIVHVFDAVQGLFDQLDVAAVLTISSTYSMDGAMNLIARAQRIPSLTLQHGLMAEHDLFAHIPVLAMKKMVWGSAIADWYQKFGFPASRVSAIGSPRFDVIFNQPWCGKPALCEKLGVDPTKKILIYAADILRIEQIVTPVVLEGLQQIPDLVMVMLLHPGENGSPHQRLAENYANCKVIPFGKISLYDALSGADIFATCYSTAALEAMFFKLPVVTVEPFAPTFSYGRLGASLMVTDAAELHRVITRLISDESFRNDAVQRYQDFLTQYCIPDGFASQRLFDEIRKLCDNGGVV